MKEEVKEHSNEQHKSVLNQVNYKDLANNFNLFFDNYKQKIEEFAAKKTKKSKEQHAQSVADKK